MEPLVRFRNNGQLEQDEREVVAAREAAQMQTSPVITSLSSYVTRCWEAVESVIEIIASSTFTSGGGKTAGTWVN